jgi:inosine-uridine nucleoside N-ribohydrolase
VSAGDHHGEGEELPMSRAWITLNWWIGLAITLVLALLVFGADTPPSGVKKIPILLDTDIGSDVDDAFALALILASPELELRGITTVSGDTHTRARIACRFLSAVGRPDIPVAAGAAPQPDQKIGGQAQYLKTPAAADHRAEPLRESAVSFLYRELKARPGKLTLVAIGPLTNVARLLREHPECKAWIKHIILMGGSVRVGYKGQPPAEREWNVLCDPRAAQAVFTSSVPLVVAPLDATATLKLGEPLRRKLFRAGTPLADQLQVLYRLWGQPTPTLYDPVAVTLCMTERFCRMEKLSLEVDAQGFTRVGKGEPNERVATSIRGGDFLKWYVDRVASARLPGRRPDALRR